MLNDIVVIQIVERESRSVGRGKVSFDSPLEQLCDEDRIAI
jgi:hypothetical protein